MPTTAAELEFLRHADPGQSRTFLKGGGRILSTHTVVAENAPADRSADGARHIVCQTVTTRYMGPDMNPGVGPTQAYVSTLRSEDHMALLPPQEQGYGRPVRDGGPAPIRRLSVQEAPGGFDRTALEDAHGRALAGQGVTPDAAAASPSTPRT